MKPILLNTEMVRAVLDGRKTQTRRVVKPQPKDRAILGFQNGILSWGEMRAGICYEHKAKPRYQPGDILYVRETWAENTIPHSGNYAGIEYRADYYGGREPILCWRPSIHMPKEAARIFLRVTDVRVERLQTISLENCISEGAVKKPNITKRGDLVLHSRYRNEFAVLWNSTIKPTDRERYGWEANPWVWVICFERINKEAADE